MKAAKHARPSLPAVSEEMKVWSAALVAEIIGWPHVSTRSFFGFTALYRKDKMFAALPRTRALETANSLIFRLESPTPEVKARLEKIAHPWSTKKDKARWFAFEFRSDADMHDALEWLWTAYESVGKKKKPA